MYFYNDTRTYTHKKYKQTLLGREVKIVYCVTTDRNEKCGITLTNVINGKVRILYNG